MIEKHGSEAAVRAFMRTSSDKSERNKVGTGYFAQLKTKDPDLHIKLSKKGGESGKRGKAKETPETDVA